MLGYEVPPPPPQHTHPPTVFHEGLSGGERFAPQLSEWFALTGSTAFWEEWTPPL